ncbi:hypothetical protein [Klebsiella michiganensis]|uniref:hypothetical protein n=1 Tax=Klebsiella michiganensis TaxID=1134687 RepID=UPI003984399D
MNIKEIGDVFHCDCGFSWSRGKNGNHNCANGLREKVRQLAAENVGLKSAIADHSQSVHFCEVCGKDDPCSTDDVCYVLRETPATDRIVAGIKADALPDNIAEIIDSGDLETICYESERSYAEDFRLALYNFRQLRGGAK